MARLAATEYGADWVMAADADEFWVPRRGTIKDVLGAVPLRFGIVAGVIYHFVPRPGDGESFAERMTVRLVQRAPVNDPTSPLRPSPKSAFRVIWTYAYCTPRTGSSRPDSSSIPGGAPSTSFTSPAGVSSSGRERPGDEDTPAPTRPSGSTSRACRPRSKDASTTSIKRSSSMRRRWSWGWRTDHSSSTPASVMHFVVRNRLAE